MIISSIRQDEQGTLAVSCTLQLAKAQIDGVEQRGPHLGSGHHHSALQVLDAIREGAGEFGALVEADQEEFILRIGGLEKLQRRFSGLPNFVGHAPAEIEYDADGDGYVLR